MSNLCKRFILFSILCLICFISLVLLSSNQFQIYGFDNQEELIEDKLEDFEKNDHNPFEDLIEQYELGLITTEEKQQQLHELTTGELVIKNIERNISGFSINARSNIATVNGTLRWEERTNGRLIPLKYMRVVIWLSNFVDITEDQRIIAETFTDRYGNFTISFNHTQHQQLLFRVHPESRTFIVNPQFPWGPAYSHEFDITNLVSSGMTTTINSLIPYSGQLRTQAFYVAQGLVVGQRFAEVMGAVINRRMNVRFPSTLIEIFNGGNNGFAIGEISGIGQNSYRNWNLLIHEYGHFIQHQLGINNIVAEHYIAIAMDHHIDEDLLNRVGTVTGILGVNDKEHFLRLAWTEAWATAFSLLAQNYFRNEYGGVQGHNAFFASHFTPTVTLLGQGQQRSIIKMLLRLFDEAPDNSHFQRWWDATTIRGTFTLRDFLNNINYRFPNERDRIGRLLEESNISPRDVRIQNSSDNILSLSLAPLLSWEPGGSRDNRNRRFQIMFYDSSNQLIHSTDPYHNVVMNNGRITYQVTEDDWRQATSNVSGRSQDIRIVVYGFTVSGSVVSGKHFSQNFTVIVHPFYTNNIGNNDIAITGVRGLIAGEITIPERINGRNITTVNARAFANQAHLRRITIPNTVINVGEFAFSNTDNLIINITNRTSIAGSWHQHWNPHGHRVQFNGIFCTHNFVRNGNIETCQNCGQIRPVNALMPDHLHGSQIRNNNPVMVDVWIITGSSDNDQMAVRIHIHLQPNQIFTIPASFFNGNFVNVWFSINGVNTRVEEVNNQKPPIPNAPTIVSGRTIRNDNSFHVNVWISYDSSGDGDSFTYIFRAGLIPGQTLVVPGAGNHWSGFTIWFEANGQVSTSLWFS
ncbi:MAG: leucine-rich repeat domain-containing protein [Erysipelotrichales bacterium]|nr:leucine-rich repeat domain-containing protein [Erysipelotrichales bacterium]